MARNTQLLQLVAALRDELYRAENVAVGVDDLPVLKEKLRRTQEVLYDAYAWPFLRQVWDKKSLLAGERYYDFPDGLNLERVEAVYLWYSNRPLPIPRGISVLDYAIYDPYSNARSEPAQKWDVRWTGVKEQFEIWPLPSSNAQSIQFVGMRDLRPLIKDSDRADLDDHLVVLTAAAEISGRQGSPSAAAIGGLAAARFATLKSRLRGASRDVRMGMGTPPIDARLPIVVHARPNTP